MATSEEVELCFPQLLNSSCRRNSQPRSVSMLIYITLFSISVLTVTLNLLVVISISHFKKLHTPTNTLLLSLAVSDFFVGFIFSFQIVLIDGCWFLGDLMCVLYAVLDYVITSASVGTIVLISVDRYVAICDPLHYPTKVTQNRAKICVSLCWIFSALCHNLMLKDNLKHPGRYNPCRGACVIVVDYIAEFANLCLTFIGPVTVIIVLYVRVFVVAVSQAHTMRSHISAVTLQGSRKVKKSEMKAARALGVLVVTFLICLCPTFSLTLASEDSAINPSAVAIVLNLFYFNSCLNPVIYAFFYPWFRKSVKLIVTLQILKPGSCEANML